MTPAPMGSSATSSNAAIQRDAPGAAVAASEPVCASSLPKRVARSASASSRSRSPMEPAAKSASTCRLWSRNTAVAAASSAGPETAVRRLSSGTSSSTTVPTTSARAANQNRVMELMRSVVSGQSRRRAARRRAE